MQRWEDLDLNQPINWAHPLNRGRLAWWLAMPGRYGAPTWWDLAAGLAANFTNTASGFGWNTFTNPGGAGSIKFTGATAFLSAGSALTIQPTAISAAAWVYASALSGTRAIVGRNPGSTGATEGWLLDANGTTVRFICSNGTTGATASKTSGMATGSWYRLVGTFDNTTVRLYINGVQAATASLSGNLSASTSTALEIGQAVGISGIWNGYLNDVSIWNRALSAAEVSQDFYLSQEWYPDILNWTFNDVLIPLFAPATGGRVFNPIVYRPPFRPEFFE